MLWYKRKYGYIARSKGQTRSRKKSFSFQGPSCFNELTIEIRSLGSVVVFKHRLKEHMQGVYSYIPSYSIFTINIEEHFRLFTIYIDDFTSISFSNRALIDNSTQGRTGSIIRAPAITSRKGPENQASYHLMAKLKRFVLILGGPINRPVHL